MANGLNKYLHGTVWSWMPGEDALIISSDEHNSQISEVNCVSITNVSKGASVSIDKDSHIQFSQIHTIQKQELATFKGAVPAPILFAVKARIQGLFNMGTSRDEGNLQCARDTAAKLVGQLARIDSDHMPYVAEPIVAEPLVTSVAVIEPPTDVAEAVATSTPVAEPTQAVNPVKNDEPDIPEVKAVSKKKSDKPSKKSRDKKTQPSAKINDKTGKPKRQIINYTDEDEAFVLDGNPTIDEIIKRFNFKDKKQAYAARTYLKSRRAKS